jgi:hypothetical protein
MIQTWHSGSRVPSGRDPQLLIVTAELLVNACKNNGAIASPDRRSQEQLTAQESLGVLADRSVASNFAMFVDILGCICSASVSRWHSD